MAPIEQWLPCAPQLQGHGGLVAGALAQPLSATLSTGPIGDGVSGGTASCGLSVSDGRVGPDHHVSPCRPVDGVRGAGGPSGCGLGSGDGRGFQRVGGQHPQRLGSGGERLGQVHRLPALLLVRGGLGGVPICPGQRVPRAGSASHSSAAPSRGPGAAPRWTQASAVPRAAWTRLRREPVSSRSPRGRGWEVVAWALGTGAARAGRGARATGPPWSRESAHIGSVPRPCCCDVVCALCCLRVLSPVRQAWEPPAEWGPALQGRTGLSRGRRCVARALSQLCRLKLLGLGAPPSSPVSLGPCLAVGPASPCAWNVCGSRNAPSVASDSDEDAQKVAVTSEAVSMGPGREAPPLPTSGPRCTGVWLSPALRLPRRRTLLPVTLEACSVGGMPGAGLRQHRACLSHCPPPPAPAGLCGERPGLRGPPGGGGPASVLSGMCRVLSVPTDTGHLGRAPHA